MEQRSEYLYIVFFPYIYIQDKKGVQIDKLQLKPSFHENIDREEANIKKHIENIRTIFRNRKNDIIREFSYIVSYAEDIGELENLKEKLNKFTTIFRFSQLHEPNSFAKFDHFNYFIFLISKELLEQQEGLFYYPAFLNGENPYHFTLENNDVAIPYRFELIPLYLFAHQINEDEYFKKFYIETKALFADEEEKRFLRAIEWFNRSFSHDDRGVDLSEAILNVNTALEALLRPVSPEERHGVKLQLRTALYNLLCHSVGIDKWFESFWKLRCKIVHGSVDIPSFIYKYPGSDVEYMHQLTFGRKIFTRCLQEILKIKSDLTLHNLEKLLKPNDVRVKETLKLFSETKDVKELYDNSAFKNIRDLRDGDYTAQKPEIVKLGSELLPLLKRYLPSIEISDKPELIIMIDEAMKVIDQIVLFSRGGLDRSKLDRLVKLYIDLNIKYTQIHQQTPIPSNPVYSLRAASRNFIDYAKNRLRFPL